MRVLVTGSHGFIGTILTAMLNAEGHEAIGLDSDLYRRCTYGDEIPDIRLIRKDVRDVEMKDLEGFDAIVHLAALSNDLLGNLNPELTMEINHVATINLAKMAKEIGIQRFLFSSSCSSYGAAGDQLVDENVELNPITPYALSKVLVERDMSYLADDNFSPTYLRNSTAYGISPRIRFDVVLNNLVAWAFTTGHIFLKSDGTPWRPIIHIEDIARAFISVLEAPRETVHNMAYNVGVNDENYQISQLAEIVKETVPNCRVEYASDAGPDKRCYRVDFSKYWLTFPENKFEWNAEKGAKQLFDSYVKFGLEEGVYESSKFKRIAHIKHLLSEGLLDNTLRWTNGTK